jgi:hypothetical protein
MTYRNKAPEDEDVSNVRSGEWGIQTGCRGPGVEETVITGET